MPDQFVNKMVHELLPGDLIDGEGNQYLEYDYDTYALRREYLRVTEVRLYIKYGITHVDVTFAPTDYAEYTKTIEFPSIYVPVKVKNQ